MHNIFVSYAFYQPHIGCRIDNVVLSLPFPDIASAEQIEEIQKQIHHGRYSLIPWERESIRIINWRNLDSPTNSTAERKESPNA